MFYLMKKLYFQSMSVYPSNTKAVLLVRNVPPSFFQNLNETVNTENIDFSQYFF